MEGSPQLATCRLCLKEATLIYSHIISEFAYKQLYDEKNRLNVVSGGDIPQAYRYQQRGFRQYLLCGDCEALLNRNEAYVSQLFDGRTDAVVARGSGLVSYSGLDYQKFRLFFLSILWRSAVTSHEFFQDVRLASNREERLRKMLLAEDPGYPTRDLWPMLFGTLVHDGKLLPGFMAKPIFVQLDSHGVYRFVFGGLWWDVYVSSHQQPAAVFSFTPHTDGTLDTVESDLAEFEYLRPLLEALPTR